LAVPWWIRWLRSSRLSRELASRGGARRPVDRAPPRAPDVLKVAVDRVPLDAPRISRTSSRDRRGRPRDGIRTVAHIGRSRDAIDAVESGVDALAHIVYVEEISEEAVAEGRRAPRFRSSPDVGVRFEGALLQENPAPYLPLELEIARPDVLAMLKARPTSFDRRPLDRWFAR